MLWISCVVCWNGFCMGAECFSLFSMFISVCFVLTICSFVAGYFYTFCCRIFLANFQSSVASSSFFLKIVMPKQPVICRAKCIRLVGTSIPYRISFVYPSTKKIWFYWEFVRYSLGNWLNALLSGKQSSKKNNNNNFDVMYELLNWARVPILWQWKSFLHFNWQVPKTNQIKHVFSYSKPTVICIPNALFHIPNVQYISFVYVFEFILWMEKNEKYLLFHTLSQNNNSLKPPLLSAQNLWMNGKKG